MSYKMRWPISIVHKATVCFICHLTWTTLHLSSPYKSSMRRHGTYNPKIGTEHKTQHITLLNMQQQRQGQRKQLSQQQQHPRQQYRNNLGRCLKGPPCGCHAPGSHGTEEIGNKAQYKEERAANKDVQWTSISHARDAHKRHSGAIIIQNGPH